MSITASDLVRLSRLLDEALAMPPAGWPAWLGSLPLADEHLRDTLADLLAEHALEQPGRFMQTLPKLGAAALPDDTIAHPGDRVGPYALLRELGQGGMGSVWLADRVDGGLVRQIALKLPRLAWGAGLAERMRRERDIGALLEHPNIARLYDAGIDALGRPYLALEYIPGLPIDAWCDSRAISLAGRLRLVVQVARAVSHAHARLVVHRDLKPGNILVTPDGQTHLLDFGIAKRLQDDDGVDSLLTRLMGRALTPHYASPEQVRGDTVTVVSDVYSLGVLAYELLTGCLPRSALHAGLGHPAVADAEAPPASSRVADRPRARALRGELDAILAKALQPLPTQRYRSADAFADDIERHLRGEPVQARPDSAACRLARLVLRHRVGLAATTSTTLAVLAGSVVAIAQTLRADLQQGSLQALAGYTTTLLQLAGGDGTETRAAAGASAPEPAFAKIPPLDLGARLIGATFADQPALQARLYGAVAAGYETRSQPALVAFYAARQAQALQQSGSSANGRAHALLQRALGLLGVGRDGEASQALREAVSLAADDPELQARLQLAQIEADLALGRLKEAGSGLDKLEAMVARLGALATVHRADVLLVRARWLRLTKGLEAALPFYTEALRLALLEDGPLALRTIDIQRRLAGAYREARRTVEAKATLAAATTAMRTLGGAYAIDAALLDSGAARQMYAQQDISFDEALAVIEQMRAQLADLPGSTAAARAQADRDLGAIQALWGDIAHADTLVSQASAVLLDTTVSATGRISLASLSGVIARSAGRHAEADDLLQRALVLRADAGLEDGVYATAAATTLIDWATNLMMAGQLDEAEAVLDRLPPEAALPRRRLDPASDGAAEGDGDAPPLPGANTRAESRRTLGTEPAGVGMRYLAPGATRPAEELTGAGTPASAFQSPSAWARLLRARIHLERGDPHTALDLLPARPPADAYGHTDRRLEELELVRGAAWCQLGRTGAGLAKLQRITEMLAQDRHADHPGVAYWRASTGSCALAAGQTAQAQQLALLAQSSFERQPGVSPFYKTASIRLNLSLQAGAAADLVARLPRASRS